MGGVQCQRAIIPGTNATQNPLKRYPDLSGLSSTLKTNTINKSKDRRVLVVDDDRMVLDLTGQMLTRLGYLPILADSALDALFQFQCGFFDILLTDFEMPMMNGYQLAKELKAKSMWTKIIIMTGQCPESIAAVVGDDPMVEALIFKPFTLNVLKSKIECLFMARPRGFAD